MSLTRRSVLKFGAVGAGAAVAGLTVPLGQSASTKDWISSLPRSRQPKPFTKAFRPSPVLPYRPMQDADGPYRLYTVSQRASGAQIIDGFTTPVVGYSYKDAGGGSVDSVPGPTISVPQGTRVKLRVKNELPGEHGQWGHDMGTSTHLHGSASLPQYDGYADDVTKPGEYKDYWYPNFQAARTLWYHDHGVHHTAKNVYSGLFAQYHLHDEAEKALLPQGRYDVPITITDAMFGSNGSLAYDDRDHSGLWGDVILVNGTPWPVMEVQRHVYRFRILVATLSRSFTFRLVETKSNRTVPVHVVATDGGLMPKTQTVSSWRHASAERYEVLVDFRSFPAGSVFELRNASAKNNRDYLHTGKVMQFRVAGDLVKDDGPGNTIPTTLVSSPVMGLSASQAVRTRFLDLEHDDDTDEFMINGRTWHDVQDSDYTLLVDDRGPAAPGSVEVWEIENKSGGWFHPLHLHLTDFKILSRQGGSGRVQPWEQGPKDVVYVGEGEIIKLAVKYEMPPDLYGPASAGSAAGGRYMIHCHNLPHEDHDMMLQFQVGTTPEVNDPVRAARPRSIRAGDVYEEDGTQLGDLTTV